MQDKQIESIVNERCEILGKLVEKIGNLKYNGAMVQTSEDFYIPASVWENRFNDNPSEHVDSIIWRALEQAVSEDATFKENEHHGNFLSKHCDEPIGQGDLFVYKITKDGVDYIISIILRWYCRNWYIMEYKILSFTEPIGNFGLQYFLDYLYKVNWTKFHLPLRQVRYENMVICYLPTNEVVNVPEIVKQYLEEQKESKNER